MKKTVLATSVAAALGLSASASAGLWFDGTGMGGSGRQADVQTFDWGPSSAAGAGAQEAVADAEADIADGTLDDDHLFDLYTNARAGLLLDGDNDPVEVGHLNMDYELTFVLGFRENVSDFGTIGGDDVADFSFVDGFDFFEIWIDTGLDSDQLTGSGFNDGTLILSGDVTSVTTTDFRANVSDPTEDLDQTSGGTDDDYDGSTRADGEDVDTVTGSGGTAGLTITTTFVNTDYFFEFDASSGPIVMMLELVFDAQQTLPFDQVDPAECFVDAAGGTGVSECDTTFDEGLFDGTGASGGATGFAPEVGSINAFDNGIAGESLVFEADGRSSVSFQKQVPAPASLALLGLGLGILGWRGRCRRTIV